MSEKLSEENRALIKHLESRLGISPQMADYLIEHWGQANILLNVAREEGEERLRAAMKRQWREDETCRRLDDVRANIAGLRPGDAEAIAAFQEEFVRLKDAARAEARPAPVVDREDALKWFLKMIVSAEGFVSSYDGGGDATNVFCGDFEPIDTWNWAEQRGLTTTSFDSMSETSTARITEAGRAYLSNLAPLTPATSPVEEGMASVADRAASACGLTATETQRKSEEG